MVSAAVIAYAAVAATVLSAAAGAYTSVQSANAQEEAARQQEQAAREAQRIADENAQLKRLEIAEKARRLGRQFDTKEAEARAKAAASGVEVKGSIADYLQFMGEEHSAELDWLNLAGEKQVDIIQRQGSYASQQAKAKAKSLKSQATATRVSGALNTTGSLLSSTGSTYRASANANWWE